ncbi:MAG: NYN domain-containing protein [Chloroflexi bacterium]|nr:NYN domain-containing protein [Chloroflexota bacterium]
MNGNETLVDSNLAVLIDYENVGLDAIQRLLDQLSDVGRVIIRRAYGDWSVQRNKQDQLLELGIEPIHQYHSNKSGKNSSDIRLAIEAIDLLYNNPIDTFVIVSSDSDFVPLVGKLRSSGKSVIVAGRREATSPTLIKSCDRYIFLDTAEKQPTSHSSSPSRRRNYRRNGRQTSSASNPETEARSLLQRAMDASMDESGEVVGSKLYQTMRRIEPSFNFKDLKYRAFNQFLEAHTDVIEMTRPKDGSGDVVVHFTGREHITPPPVSADNENRAARLVDPAREAEQEGDTPQTTAAAAPEPAEQGKPSPIRAKPNAVRRQGERRSRSGRRLLGSTRPQAGRNESLPASDEKPVGIDDVAISDSVPVAAGAESLAQPKQSVDQDKVSSQKPEQPKPDTNAETNGVAAQVNWEVLVDEAWAKRDVDKIAGRSAASDAAKILGAAKLSESEYPTLEKLLTSSTLLQLNWRREGNAIFRK